MNFTRGKPYTGNALSGNWNSWDDTFNKSYYDNFGGSGRHFGAHPEAMLSDIAFDNGSSVLGFRDRFGDQNGRDLNNPFTPADTDTYDVVSAGDLLRAYPIGVNSFALENNGTVTLFDGTVVTSSGGGNNEGPGGHRFYWDQYYNEGTGGTHKNISEGAVVLIPGLSTVMSNGLDPTTNINSGGVRAYETYPGTGVVGKADHSYQIYATSTDGTTFAKSDGMGGLAVELPLPPSRSATAYGRTLTATASRTR